MHTLDGIQLVRRCGQEADDVGHELIEGFVLDEMGVDA